MYHDILLRKRTLFKKLNFDIDLHIAIYIHSILKNIFDFSLNKYNDLIIIKNSDTLKYDFQHFKYLIQYTIYNDLVAELPTYNNIINKEINELRQSINCISLMKFKVIKTEKNKLLKLINDELKLKKKLKDKENSINRENNVVSKFIRFIVMHLNTDDAIIELFKNIKTVLHNLEILNLNTGCNLKIILE